MIREAIAMPILALSDTIYDISIRGDLWSVARRDRPWWSRALFEVSIKMDDLAYWIAGDSPLD